MPPRSTHVASDGRRRPRLTTPTRTMGALLVAAVAVSTGLAVLPIVPATAQHTVSFGAFPGQTPDRTSVLNTFEDQIDRELDFVRVFERWNSTFPNAFHDTVIDSDRGMLLSVRARNTDGTVVSWRSIADAVVGSSVHTQMVAWVERVRDVGKPVWFTFNHEPETVANLSNGDADDFVDAWQRVVDEFRSRGVTNVEFVWIMTDYSFEVPSSDRRHADHWYPGDGYVDHIAADAYNWSSCRTTNDIPWESLASIITPLRDFGAEHPDKGLMLGEWGSTTQGGDKAAWITAAANLFKQPGWEQFVALSYFSHLDTSYPDCNWPITSSQSSIDAFAAMGADPFYNGDDDEPPPPPPPSGNIVFTGTVDRSGATAPRTITHTFVATGSGQYSFTLSWPGSANLGFVVREVSTNRRVGGAGTTAEPEIAVATLASGTAYSVSVSSVSGTAGYTMTIDPPG